MKLFIPLLIVLFCIACGQQSPKQVANTPPVVPQLHSSINFNVITKDKEELKIFEDGIIPWISIKDPEPNIAALVGGDEVVLTCDSAILQIDYPLNNPVELIIKPKAGKGFTRSELIRLISREYNRIYQEEEASAKTKTVPMEQRTGLINRNQTNGKYGIWGHDIDDLDLSSIEVHKTGNETVRLELSIES